MCSSELLFEVRAGPERSSARVAERRVLGAPERSPRQPAIITDCCLSCLAFTAQPQPIDPFSLVSTSPTALALSQHEHPIASGGVHQPHSRRPASCSVVTRRGPSQIWRSSAARCTRSHDQQRGMPETIAYRLYTSSARSCGKRADRTSSWPCRKDTYRPLAVRCVVGPQLLRPISPYPYLSQASAGCFTRSLISV